MNRIKDKYTGQTCIIVANGPSLRDVLDNHLSFLSKRITFGSNRIFLEFVPDYYAAIDELVVKQNKSEIQKMNTTKFVREGMGVTGFQLHSLDRTGFSYDITRGVFEGFTVTFVLLELAYYMGFQTALCVGLDHQYQYDGKRKEEQLFKGDDPNHFSREYFKGQKWHIPSLGKMRDAYILAKEVYERDGRRIVNLTKTTNLDVFEHDDIRNWM